MCAGSSSAVLCPDQEHVPCFDTFAATIFALDNKGAVVLDVDSLAEQRQAISFCRHALAEGDEAAAPLLEWPPAAAQGFLVKLLEVVTERGQYCFAGDLGAREALHARGD